MSRPSCIHCGCTIADGVALHRQSPNGERFGMWACDLHKHRPISAYNLLLRERDQLRDTLAAVRQALAAAGHDGNSDDAACAAIRLITADGEPPEDNK